MKICICGKGGSGKSTIVKLMADAFKKLGKDVTILDSDESNTGLFWMLGLPKPPSPLMESLGGKKKVQEKMIARFSQGKTEPEISIWEGKKILTDYLPAKYVVQKGNLRLITTGKIYQALEGCACPMGVVTREFLKKFELGPNEVILVDMDAGIEHFGRGIEASVDAVVGVVDPSLESITMAAKIKELTQSVGASFKGVIINKVNSPNQKSALFEKLKNFGVPILGTIYYYDEIVSSSLEGKTFDVPEASAEMEGIVKSYFR